ncbi:Dorsocross2 [Operophtera brumata]|uniref:Dorsocross2 n=1 Tax=Operophtera brumata TaxID=104452 RepID=A0A0L7LKP0_OPEBR|nr:Dorsocross2 [Operophtera brumata]
MSLVGRRRWRWAGGAWAAAGGAEPQSPRRLMLHPDSPAPDGADLDAQVPAAGAGGARARRRRAGNDRITKLKIDNNPFAKGFRACGQSKCKRKSIETDGTEPSTAESSEAKRPCSDATSSCSEDGSLRSSSPRSPPLVESPAPLVTTPESTQDRMPSFYPQDLANLPYMPLHMPMPLGLWPSNPISGFAWGPALPPPPPEVPTPPAPPCRRVKTLIPLTFMLQI